MSKLQEIPSFKNVQNRLPGMVASLPCIVVFIARIVRKPHLTSAIGDLFSYKA